MHKSTNNREPRMTGHISCACPGDHYRALAEHAHLQRRSIGSLVREALAEAGLFRMPGTGSPTPTTVTADETSDDPLVQVFDDALLEGVLRE